jgi:hypothetical protein
MAGVPESNFCNILYGHEYLITLPSMKLMTLCPAAALTNASATDIGYPSIGVALLKSLKSMHTRSLPFFL